MHFQQLSQAGAAEVGKPSIMTPRARLAVVRCDAAKELDAANRSCALAQLRREQLAERYIDIIAAISTERTSVAHQGRIRMAARPHDGQVP